ncbi:hypothetical protein P171DRAFT_490512 [Karstenula rhodostoma CBS 690.94]|uniref:Uncharacterized protein n=1 Tax=Karstenula rhodostoma CBS 690.94 TaxID=1392251 RepID=A0A9P4U5H7_9PLEO|nr:hypothetical protein P171DRAFT_490512 [Karstenula rhodostoma CBS 690.94]
MAAEGVKACHQCLDERSPALDIVFAKRPVPSHDAIKKLVLLAAMTGTGQAGKLLYCIYRGLLPSIRLLIAFGNPGMQARAAEQWACWGAMISDLKFEHPQNIEDTARFHQYISRVYDEAEMLHQSFEKMLEARRPFDKLNTSAYIRTSVALQMKKTKKFDTDIVEPMDSTILNQVLDNQYGLHRLTMSVLLGQKCSELLDTSRLGCLITETILPDMVGSHDPANANALGLVQACWELWATEVENFTWTKLLQFPHTEAVPESVLNGRQCTSPIEETKDSLHQLEEVTEKFKRYLEKISAPRMSRKDLEVLSTEFRYHVMLGRYRDILTPKSPIDERGMLEALALANILGCIQFEELIFYKILPLKKHLQEHQDPMTREWIESTWNLWAAQIKGLVSRSIANNPSNSVIEKVLVGLTEVLGELLEQCLEWGISFDSMELRLIIAQQIPCRYSTHKPTMRALSAFIYEDFHSMNLSRPDRKLSTQRLQEELEHCIAYDMSQSDAARAEGHKPFSNTSAHCTEGNNPRMDEPDNCIVSLLQPYDDIFSIHGEGPALRELLLFYLCIGRHIEGSRFEELVLSELLPAAQRMKEHDSLAVRTLLKASLDFWDRTGALLASKIPECEFQDERTIVVQEAHTMMMAWKAFNIHTQSIYEVFRIVLDPALTLQQREHSCFEATAIFEGINAISGSPENSNKLQELTRRTIVELTGKNDIFTERLKETRNGLSEANAQGTSVSSEMQAKSIVGHENDSAPTSLEDAIIRIGDMEKEKLRIMELFQETSREHDILKRRHQDLKNENWSEAQKKRDTETKLEEAHADAEKHKNEVFQIRKKMERMAKEHKASDEAQKIRIVDMQSSLATAIDKEKSQSVLLNRASTQNAELRKELEELKIQKKIRDLDLARYKEEANERNMYKEALDQMTMERDREVQEHEATRIKLTDAEAELQSMEATIEDLRTKFKDKSPQRKAAQDLLDQKDIEFGKALAEVRHLRKENTDLRKQLDSQVNTISALSDQQQQQLSCIHGKEDIRHVAESAVGAPSQQHEPEHPDTSKLFTSKSPKKGPLFIPIDLEDDIQRSVQNGMTNVAWKQGSFASVTKTPTERFPPLSAPASATPVEHLPYSIVQKKEKKKGKGGKK